MKPRRPVAEEMERLLIRLQQTPAHGADAPTFHRLLVQYRRLVKACRAAGDSEGGPPRPGHATASE
jgi:hypothetical protein